MSVTQTGGAEVVARLTGIQARIRDLTPVTQVAAADTMTLIDDAFYTSTAPDGQEWAGLAPKTVARRRNNSTQPLIDTGRLRSSMFSRGEASGLIFGTNTPYAKHHQLGAPAANVPQRAFLPISISGGFWSFMEAGPAGEHWRRVRDAIRTYILTGEVAL